MFPYQYIFYIVSASFCYASAQYADIFSNYLFQQSHLNNNIQRPRAGDLYLMQDKLKLLQGVAGEKVKIQLYYECLCPDCIKFDVEQFTPVVKELGQHLDIHVYPYGNARTINQHGKIVIVCQHGPPECYGNMLHACAIDHIGNFTTALLFNSCMMESHHVNAGSDDQAADKCGRMMNIDSGPIKSCAKGPRGFMLLKTYGEASHKAGFRSVPHILINGVENSGENFLHDVCAAFKNPPEECNEYLDK